MNWLLFEFNFPDLTKRDITTLIWTFNPIVRLCNPKLLVAQRPDLKRVIFASYDVIEVVYRRRAGAGGDLRLEASVDWNVHVRRNFLLLDRLFSCLLLLSFILCRRITLAARIGLLEVFFGWSWIALAALYDVFWKVIFAGIIIILVEFFGAFIVAFHFFYLLYSKNSVLLSNIYLVSYLLFSLRIQKVRWLRVGHGLVVGKAVVVIIGIFFTFLFFLLSVYLTHCFQSEIIWGIVDHHFVLDTIVDHNRYTLITQHTQLHRLLDKTSLSLAVSHVS